MRHVPMLETFVLAAATAVMLVAFVFLSGGAAFSAEPASDEAHCTCPDASNKPMRPKFAEFGRSLLDESDEIAALESIQVGLSRMDDGAPFVWKRANGRLSGIVRPTSSFRNAEGALCRHVVVLLTTGYKTRTAEGIACRSPNRRWVLEG
jgi:surface antigen